MNDDATRACDNKTAAVRIQLHEVKRQVSADD
jgi:hypothetical protein